MILKKNNRSFEYTKNDYEFMNSLSAAVLEQTPSKISRVIKIWLFTITAFIIWASLAEVDEITRGDGDVVPYGQNKIIQNLEGGIVESILVEEGQIVKEGEVILKINNPKSISTSRTNEMTYYELEAKRLRLYAEANQTPFRMPEVKDEEFKNQIKLAQNLYNSNKIEFNAKDSSFVNQIEQKEQAYKEASAKVIILYVIEFIMDGIMKKL